MALAQLVDAMARCDIESDWHAMIAAAHPESLVVLTDLNATALDEGLLPVLLPQLSARHHVLVAAVADPRVDQLAPPGGPTRRSGVRRCGCGARPVTGLRRHNFEAG